MQTNAASLILNHKVENYTVRTLHYVHESHTTEDMADAVIIILIMYGCLR